MDMLIIGIIIACIFMAHEIVELIYSEDVIVEEGNYNDSNE